MLHICFSSDNIHILGFWQKNEEVENQKDFIFKIWPALEQEVEYFFPSWEKLLCILMHLYATTVQSPEYSANVS